MVANQAESANYGDARVTCVGTAPTDGGNDYYTCNGPDLVPNPLLKLPPGAIKPGGWLRIWLGLERDGMVGHLDEVSPWIDRSESDWTTSEPPPEGPLAWRGGYERVPYWLRGYGELGYLLDDAEVIKEASLWLEAVLGRQQDDGYFGPAHLKDTFDTWPHRVMLNCLETYHEATGDERVITFMLRFYRYLDALPEEKLLPAEPAWTNPRGGELLHSIIWTYNRTGERWFLDLAGKIHRNTYDWSLGIYNTLTADFSRNQGAHCVDLSQGFREPAEYFQLTGDRKHLEATERYWRDIRRTFGAFPGGMFAGDERCRPGFTDPRQAIETCAMVEFMRSAEILTGITGDARWADRVEDVAFNSFPAALTPDFRGLHYLTAANCVQLDHQDRSPMVRNRGAMFLYSPFKKFHCCQHNVSMGWPYYAEHLWYASRGNGLAAVMYCESKVTAKVGDGTEIKISESTDYPFDDTVLFNLKTSSPVRFPLLLRIPGWCSGASIRINGRDVSAPAEPSTFVVLDRTWESGDKVELRLPMRISLTRWESNRNSISVNRGPLSYSLKIPERWEKHDGDSDSGMQRERITDDWPEWRVYPDSAWNYALELNPRDPEGNFKVEQKGLRADGPFTPENSPVEIRARAKRVPQWTMADNGMVGLVPESPLQTSEPTETVTLIPMGFARLRISSFPWYQKSVE